MSAQPSKPAPEQFTVLGTIGWVGVAALLAVAALILLNWLGPLGGR